MMAGAGGAMRATGWRATAIRFQQFGAPSLHPVEGVYMHILIYLLSVEVGSDDGCTASAGPSATPSLKTTSLAYDHHRPTPVSRVSVKLQRTRCRFAQRFGESDSEDASEKTREDGLWRRHRRGRCWCGSCFYLLKINSASARHHQRPDGAVDIPNLFNSSSRI